MRNEIEIKNYHIKLLSKLNIQHTTFDNYENTIFPSALFPVIDDWDVFMEERDFVWTVIREIGIFQKEKDKKIFSLIVGGEYFELFLQDNFSENLFDKINCFDDLYAFLNPYKQKDLTTLAIKIFNELYLILQIILKQQSFDVIGKWICNFQNRAETKILNCRRLGG